VGNVAGIPPPPIAEEVAELIILVTLIIVADELIISVELMTDETLIMVCDSLALELLEEFAMD
jgi:hypothetical protein